MGEIGWSEIEEGEWHELMVELFAKEAEGEGEARASHPLCPHPKREM